MSEWRGWDIRYFMQVEKGWEKGQLSLCNANRTQMMPEKNMKWSHPAAAPCSITLSHPQTKAVAATHVPIGVSQRKKGLCKVKQPEKDTFVMQIRRLLLHAMATCKSG